MRTRIDYFDRHYFGYVLEGAAEWASDRGRCNTAMMAEAKLLDSLQPRTVLDFGCGRGELLAMLASMNVNRQCVGYDPSPASGAFRQLTFPEWEVEDRVVGTDSDFTLPDQIDGVPGFDLVVARNLYGCLDPEAIPRSFMAEVNRTMRKLQVWCRPGGKIALKVPVGAPIWVKDELPAQLLQLAGAARHILPWRSIDTDGRLYLGAEGMFQIRDVYKTLTEVNPWPGSAAEFAAQFFPEWKMETGDGWLVFAR